MTILAEVAGEMLDVIGGAVSKTGVITVVLLV